MLCPFKHQNIHMHIYLNTFTSVNGHLSIGTERFDITFYCCEKILQTTIRFVIINPTNFLMKITYLTNKNLAFVFVGS